MCERMHLSIFGDSLYSPRSGIHEKPRGVSWKCVESLDAAGPILFPQRKAPKSDIQKRQTIGNSECIDNPIIEVGE